MDIFMPCQPYLIRHIKNNDELLSYAKMYFTSCDKRGMDTEEALLRYKATASAMLPKDRPQLFQYREEVLSDEEFLLALKSDPELPKALPCHKYCKDTLGSCDLCKTCSYYSGYTNADIEEQLSLLKYILSSYDGFLSVKDYIKTPKSVFKGYSDILMNLNEADPLSVPIYQFIYKAIESIGGDLYCEEDMMSRLLGLKQTVVSLLVKSSKTGKYDKVLAIPAARFDKIWQILCNDIMNAADIPVGDAVALVSGNKDRDKAVNEVTDFENLPDIGDILFDADSFDDKEEKHNESDKKNASVIDPISEKEPSVNIDDPENVIDTEKNNSGEGTQGNKICSSQIPDEVTASEPYYNAVNVGCEEGRPEIQEDSEPDNSHTEHKAVIVVSYDDPLFVPSCSTLTFTNPERMKNDFLLSKLAPVEVFDDNMGGLCFVFLLRDNFYVCKPDSTWVKEIMSNKKIVKICWHPFDIYSLCAAQNIAVRSLYSILETELSCFDGKDSTSYWTICSKYADTLPVCKNDHRHSVGMTYYRRIYANQSGRVEYPCNNGKIHSYFEVLGRSYRRNRNLRDNGRLFKMSSNGRIIFDGKFDFNAIVPGNEVTVILDGLRDVSEKELFVSMLGRFCTERFDGLQVVAITDKKLTLFVPDELYDYVSSYIQTFFDKYALRTGNMDMNIHFATKHHDPLNGSRPQEEATPEPISLMDVLDMLAMKTASSKNVPLRCEISLDALPAENGAEENAISLSTV